MRVTRVIPRFLLFFTMVFTYYMVHRTTQDTVAVDQIYGLMSSPDVNATAPFTTEGGLDNTTMNTTELPSRGEEIVMSGEEADAECPIVYTYSEGCYIRLRSRLEMQSNEEPLLVAELSLNNVTVFEWKRPRSHMFLATFADDCRVQHVQTFDDGDDVGDVLAYSKHVQKRTVMAGVVHYSHALAPFYQWLTPVYWRESNHYTSGSTAFITPVGYRGLMTAETLAKSGKPSVISDTVYFGTPFNYSLEGVVPDDVNRRHGDVELGGHWSPGTLNEGRNCQPRWSIAIVVPYRNRETHLWMFIDNMVTFLQAQLIDFTFIVVEQAGPELFNRAALMNIGYMEARKLREFDCYVFHDVDMVPEDLANIYRCDDNPRHLITARSVTGYRKWRRKDLNYIYFGGAIIMTSRQIQAINGFPNTLFGWGGEDDDIYARVTRKYDILRSPEQIGTYICFEHGEDAGNPHIKRKASTLYDRAKHCSKFDGLNSANYNLLSVKKEQFYTNISVTIPGPKTIKQVQQRSKIHHDILKQRRMEDTNDKVTE